MAAHRGNHPAASCVFTIFILLTASFWINNGGLYHEAPLWRHEPPVGLNGPIISTQWTIMSSTIASLSPLNVHRHRVLHPLDSALARSGDIHTNPGPSLPNTTPSSFKQFPRKGLNFLHVNARSILPKLDELRIIAQQTNAAVLCVTETWIDSSVTDNEINIDGYSVLRCDRNRSGGGACMYIRTDLAFNRRNDLNADDNEAVWCDLLLPKSKPILLGVIYRSQIYTDVMTRMDNILNIIPPELETYILGDFNICTLEKSLNSSLTKSYLGRLSGAGFENIINEPTRVTDNTESCLDHILGNNIEKVFQCGVMPTGFSDHFLVYCTRRSVRMPLHSHNRIRIRSMKKYSVESFNNMLSNCDWSTVLNSECVNTAWMNFKTILTNVLNQIAPERDVRIKIRTEPWMTPAILEKIKNRDKIRRKILKGSSDFTYQDFTALRNEVQRDIKNAKASFFKSKLEDSMGNPRKLWEHLKQLGYNNKSKSKGKIVLNINGSLCYDTLSVCNHINTFFTNIASTLVSKLPTSLKEFCTDSVTFKQFYLDKGVMPSEFDLKSVNEDFVLDALSNLDPHKGAGLDGLAPKFLKDGAPQLAPVITHIINLSIVTKTVPDDLKCAKIIPLFKKKSRLDVGNYRPVSILSCMSKILEKCIFTQIDSYLREKQILYNYQSGFRPGFSTETCLIHLTDYIRSQLSEGNYVGMLLLDVQKAFDSVNHDILCSKLESMGINPGWFKSYLSNRQQLVSVDGISSDFQKITCGVPQGSLLGPLLYLCYSNDMVRSVRNKLLLYADDSVILVSDKDPSVVSHELSKDLESCNNWLIDNQLSLHVGKTECILFGSHAKLKRAPDFNIIYNGKVIPSQDCINYLGVTIDQTVSGDKLVDDLVKKVVGRIKFLYRHSSYLNQTLRKNLSAALIQCHLDYCCSAWFAGINTRARHKLQVTQNKIVRFILNLSPRTHIDQFNRNLLRLLNTQDRAKQLRLNHVFNIFNGIGAPYLTHNFIRTTSAHSHRTRSSNFNFIVPRVKGIASKSFYYNAILDWNALPPQIQTIRRKMEFKKAVKKHLADCALKQESEDFIRV